MLKVAIDGPSGAGKSTLSKRLAKELGFIYIDTGAMYRAAGLSCLYKNIDIKKEPEAAASAVEKISIDINCDDDGLQHVFLDGKDVNDEIRTPEVSMAASDVSAIGRVRVKLVELQRRLAENHNVLMDGRDIGTHVLPNADIKIFLTASAEIRAKRRYDELIQKGVSCEYDDVLKDMRKRDKNDSEREISPLRMADDGVLVDTSDIDFEESFKVLLGLIKERLGL